jgi:hypothetical protein
MGLEFGFLGLGYGYGPKTKEKVRPFCAFYEYAYFPLYAFFLILAYLRFFLEKKE